MAFPKKTVSALLILIVGILVIFSIGTRSDTFISRFMEVSPTLSYISHLLDSYIPSSDRYLLLKLADGIDLLKQYEDHLTSLPAVDKQKISMLIHHIDTDPSILYSLEPLVNKESRKTLLTLYRLTTPFDTKVLKEKISAFDKHGGSIGEQPKLTPNEFGIITSAPSLNKLLSELQNSGIEGLDHLRRKWTEVGLLEASRITTQVKKHCTGLAQNGIIFIVDRESFYAIRGLSLKNLSIRDWDGALRHILFGAPHHMGIFIQTEQGTCISHISSDPGFHTVHPKPLPLFTSYCLRFRITLTPLLPKNISPSKLTEIEDLFYQKYQALASIEHPSVPMAGLPRLLTGFLLGKKRIFPLSPQRFKFFDNQAELCTGYIAKIIALAIEETNQELQEKCIIEQISNPFSTHDKVDTLSIPQLARHMKHLGIFTLQAPDPFLSEILSPPTRLEAFWHSL